MTDDEPIDRVFVESEYMRLQIAHAQAQLYDRRKQQIEDRRRYARQYYAAHREEQLEYQRQRREAQRESDPERYAELRRGRAKRWYDRHKEDQNAKQRAKYRADPQPHLERRSRYYAEHAEEIKAKRRERYAANKEQELARQEAWRDRERRRREVGLPVRRIHAATHTELQANEDAAGAFFARRWSGREIRRMRKAGAATPPELVTAWLRDCARARATFHLAEQKEELERLQKELARAKSGPMSSAERERLEAQRIADEEREAKRLEEERLDAIGREVNERLRHHDPPRRVHHNDPAAPHPLLLQQQHQMGLDR
ncbi:hypothetical protein [Microbacterium candidum]|uniref:Uncharacterized protein n=1 Tax=Microbacterium candidum TaxID=3041922 RepID=A0ABT7MVW9_9MICO|nr:hypothetical protein [Microbacterium sp. ASV49]MDL9978586.1 hypothetical protein [Microbacterium sp. ASV49]